MIFVVFNYGAEISAKRASQPTSCYQVLDSIARFYALPLDLTDFPKLPEHTHKSSATGGPDVVCVTE